VDDTGLPFPWYFLNCYHPERETRLRDMDKTERELLRVRICGNIKDDIRTLFSFCNMTISATPSARRATNVTLDAVLLERAMSLNINISQASEEGLSRAVAAKQAAMWLQDNQAALDSSNAYVEKHGLPLAKHRNF